jgi:CBS domain-containing protein
MTSQVATIGADESLWLAALRLETEPHSHLVVLDDRRPVGVIDEQVLAQSWPLGPFTSRHRSVGQITPGRVHTVLPEVSAARVASIMFTDGVDVVPVVDRRGKVIGLVTVRDLIRLVAGAALTRGLAA